MRASTSPACMLAAFAPGLMTLNAGMQLMGAITKGAYLGLVLWSIAAMLFGSVIVKNGRLAMLGPAKS